MRRFILSAAAALTLAIAPASAAIAAPVAPQLVSSIASTSQAAVVPNCCAIAWYPWGYYSTNAICMAAGV